MKLQNERSQAYQQLILDDESRKFVVINTKKGLFRYTRLPYGILSAPGIFQHVMYNMLQVIQGVVTYLDDILITGATEEESLEEVRERLAKDGLIVKKHKCSFMVPRVSYLGTALMLMACTPCQIKSRQWRMHLLQKMSQS